jgi:uncharacterized delta-60 repeat protein
MIPMHHHRQLIKILVLCTLLLTLILQRGYTQPGTLDPTFNPGSAANGRIADVAVQPDGKIIIVGGFSTYNGVAANNIARLHADGSLDVTFNGGSGANNSIEGVELQPDGKIIVAGRFTIFNGTIRKGIARLNSDGTLDATFNSGDGANSAVLALTLQANGKIVIGGLFTEYGGITRNFIARLNVDGSLDTSLDPGNTLNSPLLLCSMQTDGKIIVGAASASSNPKRLNSDGSLDASFTTGTGANAFVFSASEQSDGKILIGGRFSSYNGIAVGRIARLNSNGTFDATFNSGGSGASVGEINAIAIQANKKIIIAGTFSSYNGIPKNDIVRLNADGSLDDTFNPGQGTNHFSIFSLAFDDDEKLIIGGNFASYDGADRNSMAVVFTKLRQEIETVGNIADMPAGNSIDIKAFTVSGLPVQLEKKSGAGDVETTYTDITVDGNTVKGYHITATSPGKVGLYLTRPGNEQYHRAVPVTIPAFCIIAAKPSVTADFSDPEHPELTSSAAAGNKWFLNDEAISDETTPTLHVVGAGVYTVSALPVYHLKL